MLGDKDQLTSVEAGYILGDICNTGAAIQLSKEFGKLYAASTGETLALKMRPRENAMQDTIVELQRNYRFKSDGGIFKLSRAINAGDVETAFEVLRNKSHERRFMASISASAVFAGCRPREGGRRLQRVSPN